MRNLGLVGGLGPGATVHYYRELDRLHAGEMMIVHADMDLVRAAVERGDRVGLADYFARLIDRMATGGSEVAAVSAVTPHICIRQLEKISPLPLIDIIAATQAAIREQGYHRVALFGTRYVVESKLYGMLEGVELVTPRQVDEIHAAYMEIVNGGIGARATLTEIARSLPVDAVVLAGTDLSVVFDETNTEFPHVDCAKVHIDAILRALQ